MVNEIVKLIRVTAGYNNEPILKDVDLSIRQQDFLGIIGPNGGGKTTLLKVMMGLLKPMNGRVEVPAENALGERSLFGYLPQVNRIDNKFPITILDVVLSGTMKGSKYTAGRKKTYRERALDLLVQMGLDGMAKKMIGELSGGQLQRAFLARAMISSPLLLVLDEPDSFVDNNFERDLYDLLQVLNSETAIVIVSHDLGIISSFVKTIACVNRGLHYHHSNVITRELMETYNCPIDLIAHGQVPHRVLEDHHDHEHEH
ncbi:MAG: metal ABC transporter ATP-binding protein [Bacteroidales bacterium]